LTDEAKQKSKRIGSTLFATVWMKRCSGMSIKNIGSNIAN
jgi:hypothetical protein